MTRYALAFLISFALILSGCASYNSHLRSVRSVFLQRAYLEAATQIEAGLPNAGRDELLFLLEAGSCYRYASDYSRSCSNLERADELARINSYVSLTEESASILFDDTLKLYRSPEYERFFLLYLLAMNRLQMGEVENALVELRRIIEYENEIASDDKSWLRQPLAHYLAGVCYLRFREYDNARREFRIAHEYEPSNENYRVAREGADVLVEADPNSLGIGWALVFVETGLAPHRMPRSSFSATPVFVSTPSMFSYCKPSVIVSEGRIEPVGSVSFEQMAVRWLEERSLYYFAREVGSVVAKSILADQIGKVTKSRDAGEISFLLLMLSRRPDLRSWINLCQEVSIFCMPLKAGEHTVKLELDICGSSIVSEMPVLIEDGKISTAVFRFLN